MKLLQKFFDKKPKYKNESLETTVNTEFNLLCMIVGTIIANYLHN